MAKLKKDRLVLSVTELWPVKCTVLFSNKMLILLGVPALGIYNQNTVGKNGDFQPLRKNILPISGLTTYEHIHKMTVTEAYLC